MVKRTRVEFVAMNPLSAFISKIGNKKTKLGLKGPADRPDPKDEKEPSFFEKHFRKLKAAGIVSIIIIFTTVFIGVSSCLPLYPFAPIALSILFVAAVIIRRNAGL